MIVMIFVTQNNFQNGPGIPWILPRESKAVVKFHWWNDTSATSELSGTSVVQTHIMLISRDTVAFSSFVFKSCRFYGQQDVKITRRHNFDCHPNVCLLLSLVQLVVCCGCHVASFALSTWVVWFIFHPTQRRKVQLYCQNWIDTKPNKCKSFWRLMNISKDFVILA